MLMILQQVVEESTASLVAARLEAEERRNNLRLREEQDAAYRAALEADQARERQRNEEQERLEREAAEAERKLNEEKEAQEKAAREVAEKEAALARRRQEKAMSLGQEPGKGPDITQVLVRFPNGERKERRFHSSATIQSIYDYVDSLDCLTAEKYNLVSNFPRTAYGPEKHSLTLKEVTYQCFHWKKGTPFAEDQGIYKNLTWWEQMDNGKQLTRNRKFLTVVPVVLYLIASHTTDYRHPMLFLNTIAAVILVVAKLPNMHKVRIFGINSDR